MRKLSWIFLALSACVVCADELPRNLRNLPPCKKGEKRFKLNLERDWPAKPGEVRLLP